MPGRDDSFDAVLDAARSGAPWACTRLWREHAPRVSAFLAARGSREPDDLTSEVFLVVFERLGAFRGDEASFRSFVFSIAYRRLVDELRARARRGDADPWSDDLDPRCAASAEEVATRSLGDRRAIRLIGSLPPAQRDVLMLRIVADLSVPEVAAVLGKRVGAVKALQRRGLTELRSRFAAARTLSGPSVDSRK